MRAERVRVRIPAGVANGSKVRVAGYGHYGPQGGPPGDLFLEVHVAPHAFFQREGHHLKVQVPITVVEAALGAKIRVPAVDGPVTIRIPAGTRSGQIFRVSGKGGYLPHGGRGDLYVEVQIVPPEIRDQTVRKLLRDLERYYPRDPRAGMLRAAHES